MLVSYLLPLLGADVNDIIRLLLLLLLVLLLLLQKPILLLLLVLLYPLHPFLKEFLKTVDRNPNPVII